jgi:LacI family transcriptional regulator
MSNLTINDVARIAGVSVSTVSRILNRKPDVAESTRQRVWQVIDTVGYSPDLQAKRLRSNGVVTQIISLHYPIDRTIFDPIQNAVLILEFILGASVAVEAENFLFNLVTTPFTGTQLIDLFRNSQSNGMILAQVRQGDERIAALRGTNYPFIMIGRDGNEWDVNYIDLDFKNAVLVAIDHLYKLGHRHIGMLDFPQILDQQGYTPARNVSLALREAPALYAGLMLDRRQIAMSNRETTRATHAMLADHPTISAIVSVHGDCLSGIMDAFNQRNLRMPDDISLVLIASEKQCNGVFPEATRVDLPAEMMGFKAAQALIQRVRGQQLQAVQLLVHPQLLVGKTTCVIESVNGQGGDAY